MSLRLIPSRQTAVLGLSPAQMMMLRAVAWPSSEVTSVNALLHTDELIDYV